MPEFQANNLEQKGKLKKRNSSRLALGIHSMPKTSEKSFKSWFVIGGMMLLILIIFFLLLIL